MQWSAELPESFQKALAQGDILKVSSSTFLYEIEERVKSIDPNFVILSNSILYREFGKEACKEGTMKHE